MGLGRKGCGKEVKLRRKEKGVRKERIREKKEERKEGKERWKGGGQLTGEWWRGERKMKLGGEFKQKGHHGLTGAPELLHRQRRGLLLMRR